MYLLILVVIALLAYMFGIRTLNNANADMQAELATLRQQKEYLDQLKQENIETENTISELKNNIESVEQSFICNIKTENIEQYVLKVFEDNGMPYLDRVNMEDIQMNAVTLADGSASDDALLCKRVNVTYASTDGYEALQYNLNPAMNTENGALDAAVIAPMITSTGVYDEERHLGYDEFIKALKALEKADPDCIKISHVQVQSTHGYLTLDASIDFFSADLASRLSTENRTTGYATWKGETNVNTEGGFIGMPYRVDNENSRWNGVLIDKNEVTGFLPRPFASYVSNARFTQLIEQKGLAAIVGEGTVVSNEGAVETTESAA